MRERKSRPHNKLRALLIEYDVSHEELGQVLGRSHTYVSPRMTGKMPWTLDDVYTIIAFINSFACKDEPEIIRPDEIADYFPPRPRIPARKGARVA